MMFDLPAVAADEMLTRRDSKPPAQSICISIWTRAIFGTTRSLRTAFLDGSENIGHGVAARFGA